MLDGRRKLPVLTQDPADARIGKLRLFIRRLRTDGMRIENNHIGGAKSADCLRAVRCLSRGKACRHE